MEKTRDIKYSVPLAERIRPSKIEDFIGQNDVLSRDSSLYKLIEKDDVSNTIISGPPGTGKTTVAKIIANMSNLDAIYLNAGLSGVSEIKNILEKANITYNFENKSTYLIIDEIHKWNKTQFVSILDAIEKGILILIGLTTENPYISIPAPIISRSSIYFFKPLAADDIKKGIIRAVTDKENGMGSIDIIIKDDVIDYLSKISNGDMRVALNILEKSFKICEYNKDKKLEITKKNIFDLSSRNSLTLTDNLYYDLLSAFCKSIRGGSADAALYYANRLIFSGVDPIIIARRLIVHASEDVGMADSNALLISNIALNAIEKIGMPEANIPLTHAIIYVSTCPKSNSVYKAMRLAMEDASKKNTIQVPEHLKHGKNTKYKNPHDHKQEINQEYMPKNIINNKYYKAKNIAKDKCK